MFDKLLPYNVAHYILGECNKYHHEFKAITKRVHIRFENQDWHGIQADMRERLTIYKEYIGNAKLELSKMLGERLKDPSVWRQAKPLYEELALNLYYRDIAETFYNSVFRHVHKGLSVDKELMFVLSPHDKMNYQSARPIFNTYETNGDTRNLVKQLLEDYKLDAPYQDFERDVDLIHDKIHHELFSNYKVDDNTHVEVLRPIFFRNKSAYIVGRAQIAYQHYQPFIIPLLHDENGVYADALLLEYNHIASIFTYYRAHFLVDVDIPSEMVNFLHSILPHKPLSELYTCIGYEKHGKTEMYRAFLKHIEEQKEEMFDFAPGIKGMVMTVFTLPSYNMVFKIIKDNFAPPKNTSEKEVRAKYQLVTQHDRVGRLADTHLFENFVFNKNRFAPALIEELRKIAKSKIVLRGDTLEIKHLYVEKKMKPLDLYLQSVKEDEVEVRHILDEYGKAIKQLAAANIFPGDLLLKNFGVTRLKRVVFYDYDEIEWVTKCHFRELPQARNQEDEMSSEAWFYVGDKDIFPEEFPPFLFPNPQIRALFQEIHGDLFTPQYWIGIQEVLKKNEVVDVFPYPEELRFGYGGWTNA
jgi:isocitrate dehydrogenase kinase/phosphatase